MSQASPLKDPVCGMSVTEQSPHRFEHEGRSHHFCSANCKTKFAADPLKYRRAEQPAQLSPTPAGTVYIARDAP